MKEIIVSKEYFIYICVKASAQFSFTVKLSTSNLRILDQRLYTVYPGYNNVLIRCVAKNTCKKQTIGFSLLEEGTKKVLCNKRIENFCIEPSQCPEIIYYSQTKIMQEMFNYINTNSHNNRILALAAEGGMGKSYLVQNLIASLIKPNSLFMGGYFSEKTAENACVLCKLILFLSFGTLYELNEESFLLLVEQYTSMPISLLLLLKTGTYNQIVATSAISKYYDYLNNNQDISSYVGGFNEKFFVNPSYIYIEDCQKLSTKYLKLLSLILNDFKKKKYFQHIVITFRTNETMTEKVENMLSELSCPIWKLDGITKNDLAETMIHHFSERVKTISLSLPLPVNVLHFSAIITSLKSKNINSNNENLPQVIYETYQEINSLDDGYIINQFKESNYFDVLSLIYSIETGIPTNVLVSYLHEAGNQIINELKSKHQVKEENGLLKPYHDSYISAFHSFQAQKESENSIKKFLEFCLKSSFETKIIESIMISLLLNKRVYSFPDILVLYQRCLTYYNSSDYETAQIISKRIKDEETIDLEKQVYLRYIYAQCLKTTSSHKKSNDEYKKLESFIYMNGNSENNLGFLYDCISEIINNDLWMFNFEELELYLGRLKNIQTFPNSHPNLVNGYLNYHNRSMMYYSFIGKYELSLQFYNSSKSESIRLNRYDYLAYAKMDYAKTIYISDPYRAQKLLQEAYIFFVTSNAFKRRELECKCEMVFLDVIINGSSYDELYILSKDMLTHKFIHSYFKTCIKIIYLEFIKYRDVLMALRKLDLLLAQIPINKYESRHEFYVNQLKNLIYCFSLNMNEVITFSIEAYAAQINKLGDDYKYIFKHNQLLINANSPLCAEWYIHSGDKLLCNENSFWIDPRIW